MRELLELLEHDARRPADELAAMLHRSEYEVQQQINQLEKDKIILSYNTLINWEKFGDNTVTSIIEVNLTPEREVGFDAIAERIYRFDEVRTVYLMSGSFDLLVITEGKSLQDVANFVATRLSTIEGVTATRSRLLVVSCVRSRKFSLMMPLTPCTAPYTLVIWRNLRLSSTTPTRLWLMTAVGPPPWATTTLPSSSMSDTPFLTPCWLSPKRSRSCDAPCRPGRCGPR